MSTVQPPTAQTPGQPPNPPAQTSKRSWDWTGFRSYTDDDGKTHPGKTLWDWMQLLIVPALLALGIFLFQTSADQRAALQQAQGDHDLALDDAREATLQDYLDKMQDLFFNHKLGRRDADRSATVIANTLTLTALRRLDPVRKGYLLRFINDSQLIAGENPTIWVEGVDLSHTDLSGIKLVGIDLIEVKWEGTDLSGAALDEANLGSADLSHTTLTHATLTHTHLEYTDLRGVDLSDDNVYGAYLSDANLSGANLSGTNLAGADLSNADLTGANLEGAHLNGADLTRAEVTQDQLAQAASIDGATMPDGTVYSEGISTPEGPPAT